MKRRYVSLGLTWLNAGEAPWPGGCNGGALAGPLAEMVRVLHAHILRNAPVVRFNHKQYYALLLLALEIGGLIQVKNEEHQGTAKE